MSMVPTRSIVALDKRSGPACDRTVMTHDPLLPDPSAHALGWPRALLQLLPPTLTIEVSSGWLVVLLLALWIWRKRMLR